MRLDREWIQVEALKVVLRVLKNAPVIERKNPFIDPTVKELAKHPKLLRKQRLRTMGVR
jgi:hypothetical protein